MTPTQAKHTPGPWKARCCDRSSTWDVCSDDYGSIVTVHDYPHNARRLEPDARLIAAAPELLEACRLAATILQDCYPGPNKDWRAKSGLP